MNTWEWTHLFYYYQGQQDVTDQDRMQTALTIDWLLDQNVSEEELYQLVQDYQIGIESMTYDNLPDTLWDCGTTKLKLKGQLEDVQLNLIQRNVMYCHNELRTYPKVLPYNMQTFSEPQLRFTAQDLLRYTIDTLELNRKYINDEQWINGILYSFRSAYKYKEHGLEPADILLYCVDIMQDSNDQTLYNTQGRFLFKPEQLEQIELKYKQRKISNTTLPEWRKQVWHG